VDSFLTTLTRFPAGFYLNKPHLRPPHLIVAVFGYMVILLLDAKANTFSFFKGVRIMFRIFIAFFLATLLTFSLNAQNTVAKNLTNECVTDFDTEMDYFPDKIAVTDAENFTVEYFNNYKVVTVNGSMETYDYVLVQCGTPTPDANDFPEGTQFIEVPAGSIVSLSTTFLPGIAQLGLADHVVGLDSTLYTNTPEIIERIDSGEIVEVSPNFELNVEVLLEAEPDIVMTDDFDPGRLTQLVDADIFAAVNTDYLEQSPLGRAEWLKYTALFYNEEATAEDIYDEIVTAYEEASELANSVPEDERPTVLWNRYWSFSDAWTIPGAETFVGTLVEDAGAHIALGDEAPEQSVNVSFEFVYEGGLDADIWILDAFGVSTADDLLAEDPRYADFVALQTGNTWNNNLDENANGGNNYYELGVTNPHLILQDLVAIFHPDLLPDHEFTFFRPIE